MNLPSPPPVPELKFSPSRKDCTPPIAVTHGRGAPRDPFLLGLYRASSGTAAIVTLGLLQTGDIAIFGGYLAGAVGGLSMVFSLEVALSRLMSREFGVRTDNDDSRHSASKNPTVVHDDVGSSPRNLLTTVGSERRATRRRPPMMGILIFKFGFALAYLTLSLSFCSLSPIAFLTGIGTIHAVLVMKAILAVNRASLAERYPGRRGALAREPFRQSEHFPAAGNAVRQGTESEAERNS